jgi:hypothetical protein
MPLYEHVPHPHIARRRMQGPVKIADQLPSGSSISRFNSWLALKTTGMVGTMWCAYVFCLLAVIGIPAALAPGGVGAVNWFTEEFIQLVLLSVIMVGQLIQGAASDRRAEGTFADTEALLHSLDEVTKHLNAQDDVITQLRSELIALRNTGRPTVSDDG